tara:strand:- start:117 stop:1847 length:1731 start_codon:yes stop_codon:yes gene_type:complete
MSYFKRDRFSGIAPAVAPRLLSEDRAQTAQNIDFESGKLVAIKDDSTAGSLTTSTRSSIFFYEYQSSSSAWLQWTADVDVVRGPIPDDEHDRFYYTGDGFPKMSRYDIAISGQAYPAAYYRLGVPAPTSAPTVSISGTADTSLTPNDVSYVYTFVTAYGEEGPPSAPSTVTQMTDGQTATLSLPNYGGSLGSINFGTGALKRIYRSNTGSTNTQFQLVKQINYSDTSEPDDLAANALGEILPSGTWIGPPDDQTSLYPSGPLQGLIALAQGVFAGFSGKRFCLSEPFMPHAWPIDYRITTEDEIVAIASTANGVAALTDGQPYFITGTDPSAMTAVRIDLRQACVNKNSVVDMGDYVLYAAPDGLCAIQSATGQVVTRGLISVAQWNTDFYPTLIKAFRYEGTYVAFWTSGSSHGGWVFDPRSEQTSISTLSSSAQVKGGYTNPKTGELYLIVGSIIKKFRGGTSNKTLTWKTKKYVTSSPITMAWFSIDADTYPVGAKIYADGALIAHYYITKTSTNFVQTSYDSVGNVVSTTTLRGSAVMRVIATLAQEWEVEVYGTDVNEFCLAQTMDEIRAT